MISWLCFEWKTGGLPKAEAPFHPLVIRPAAKSEEEGVAKAIKSAFCMDSAWGDVSKVLSEKLAEDIAQAFSGDEPACVVLAHGSRVIGASVLNPDPDATNHLLSGPCIVHEYRNRGLASGLLEASIGFLREKGVPVVRGVTRGNSITARFIYPKFGGLSHQFNGDPLKVQAD